MLKKIEQAKKGQKTLFSIFEVIFWPYFLFFIPEVKFLLFYFIIPLNKIHLDICQHHQVQVVGVKIWRKLQFQNRDPKKKTKIKYIKIHSSW
jgi:hypothetical protein